MTQPTILVRGGEVHDGAGGAAVRADVLVQDGIVAEVRAPGRPAPPDAEVVDATGCWVTPGFVDVHTHYDAEVEVAPSLVESLRHGVTTVVFGSCGLSMAVGEVEDLADMFCRVEGIPRERVVAILDEVKDWDSPTGYAAHLAGLPLGPNVAAMVGHSTIRARAMGLERALTSGITPTPAELAEMQRLLVEALDAGFLGLSVNTLPWDKMGGTRFRSRPTPSVYAPWSEYRALLDVLRERDAVFQGLPDISTKVNILLFLGAATGLGRRPLRTMLLTFMDAKADRFAWRAAARLTELVNGRLRGRVRFQSLPNPFDLYTDGVEVPVLEEIGAGTEALHVEDPEERARLFRDPAYRERFKKEWKARFPGRAYHRDMDEARIIDAPDPEIVGRTFAQVARERAADGRATTDMAIETFLDLQAEHGPALRWYTVVANDRPDVLERIISHPGAMIGFSDAGAHLRNMAYYNFALRMLKRVRDADLAGRPFMTVEHAVHRLTGEIADFLDLDAGHLRVGARADLVVIDPHHLDDRVETIAEAPMEGFAPLQRLVRRNDDAIRAVLVNGRIAWNGTELGKGVGTDPTHGQFLRPLTP